MFMAMNWLDKKAEFIAINEHFESIFNATRASKLVFLSPVSPESSVPLAVHLKMTLHQPPATWLG